MKATRVRTALLAVCTLSTGFGAAEQRVSHNDYARAEALLSHNLGDKVKNENPEARWFGTQDKFWYRRDGGLGLEYVVVSATTGLKRVAFDHQRLADAIGSSIETEISAGALQVTEINSADGALTAKVKAAGTSFSCNLSRYDCVKEASDPPQFAVLPSPDGTWLAFTRENNIWLKHTETNEERQLTTDGGPYFSYGGFPDQDRLDAMRSGQEYPSPPANSYWSPDGRWLVVERLDEREVEDYPFLESCPANGSIRPQVISVRIPLLGDKGQRRTETFIFDVETGEQRALQPPHGFSLDFFGSGNSPIAWSSDAHHPYPIGATEGAKTIRLFDVDMGSGAVRTIIEETEKTSVILGHNLRSGPCVRFLGDSNELIWFSERDGWGHLYLYDLDSGRVKNRITTGDWTVCEIIRVDAEDRRIFFTAGGREPGSDPYYRKLYRASLDGGTITLLTPEEADHHIGGSSGNPSGRLGSQAVTPSLSPSGDFFVESYSTPNSEPRFVLRSSEDGRIISHLETADATALYATGWRAPVRFSVTSADGVTDLRGAIYFPPDFDAGGSYPVIDAIYGGQVSIVAPRTFRQAYTSGYQRASLAELGFVVISLDGRGTPCRSKAFREVGFGSFADPQLDDHVAAIKQLAQRYPALDTNRVGVYGHSNGGYLAARALLKNPDFFNVGVASAGPQNFHGLPGTGTPWMGIPRYADGSSERPDGAAIPQNYQILDNTKFAAGLKGQLLLICGDMDNTAFPALTLQLADALIKVNKDFDLLYLPNQTHMYFVQQPYVMRRIWDYFVKHLLGATPPDNYEIKPYG
ncbi:MAG: DPP IV N-terminal domain-containing protein [Acidobacteriota bacterium]